MKINNELSHISFNTKSSESGVWFYLLDFPHDSVKKNPPANARDAGLIPGSGRSLEEGNSNPLQYSCLENPMDRGVHRDFLWTSLVAQIVKCLPTMRETWVWSLGQEDPLEKGVATHSSILARNIPWTEKPGGLQSMKSQSRTRLSNLAQGKR